MVNIVDLDGLDELNGGDGDDFLNAQDGLPNDIVNGGFGIDTCLTDAGDLVISC